MPLELLIASTAHFKEIGGVRCRLWDGITQDGVECEVYVAEILAVPDEFQATFATALADGNAKTPRTAR